MKKMLGLLEDKKNDDALLEAANFLQSTMRTHLGNTPATAEHEAAAVNDQGKFFRRQRPSGRPTRRSRKSIASTAKT